MVDTSHNHKPPDAFNMGNQNCEVCRNLGRSIHYLGEKGRNGCTVQGQGDEKSCHQFSALLGKDTHIPRQESGVETLTFSDGEEQ